MKIIVTKKVAIDVTEQDLKTYRSENKAATAGHLRRDANLAKIIALDRAEDLIHRLDASVETETSIDNDADFSV